MTASQRRPHQRVEPHACARSGGLSSRRLLGHGDNLRLRRTCSTVAIAACSAARARRLMALSHVLVPSPLSQALGPKPLSPASWPRARPPRHMCGSAQGDILHGPNRRAPSSAVDQLVKVYKTTRAVDGISFRARARFHDRAPRRQRRRQDHHHRHGSWGWLMPHLRHGAGARRRNAAPALTTCCTR